MSKKQESNKICPICNNFLVYFISDDFYLKGTKFYSCEVCKWSPETNIDLTVKKCPNGCSGGTVCSECPK